jgi:hypothetical protein
MTRRQTAAEMTKSAQGWLSMLSDEQRAVSQGSEPADDASDKERRRWFYTPTDHGGLTLNEQRPSQQQAAMRLVATGLSESGYGTLVATIGLENLLDREEGFVTRFDRERGRDPGLYYLRVFGEPADSGTWGWRFGGHHLSLNNLVVDGELVSTTPCFIGAYPAESPLLGGATSRPLGRVEDLAREIVRSLPADLADRAVLLPKAPSDIVTANRSVVADGDRVIPLTGLWRNARFGDDDEQAKLQKSSDALDATTGFSEDDHRVAEYTSSPKGVPGRNLDAAQRELLHALLASYFDRVPKSASPLTTYGPDELDAVHIAWAGSIEPGEPHYYRLQGPRLLIEWDNAHNNANHAHSVWRDPQADFGLDVLALHRGAHH